ITAFTASPTGISNDAAQLTVGLFIRAQQYQLQFIQPEITANNQFNRQLLLINMAISPYHTGNRTLVCQRQRAVTQFSCLLYQLLRAGCPLQETKVALTKKLCVVHVLPRQEKMPCTNQRCS